MRIDNIVCIIKYDEKLVLVVKNEDATFITKKPFYKTRIKRYIEHITESEIFFMDKLTYVDFKKILSLLHIQLKKYEINLIEDISIKNYIKKKEVYIKERSKIGLDIKNKASNVIDKYNQYKKIVDKNMSRQLRDLQMWDSFFMATLKKSSNFSVPGSGKTSSALGVFAFLYTQKKLIK